jgi:hypothetical protein
MIFVGEIILLLRGDYWTESEFESLWILEENVDSGKSRKKAEAVHGICGVASKVLYFSSRFLDLAHPRPHLLSSRKGRSL